MNKTHTKIAKQVSEVLAKITTGGLTHRGHAASLTANLKSYRESLGAISHSSEDVILIDLLGMLKTLDPNETGKDGKDQLAYRTFSKTVQSIMGASLATEEQEAAPGFALSIKTKQESGAVKGVKQFEVGAAFVSVDRLERETSRAQEDTRREEERASEDTAIAKTEADTERAQLTEEEQDSMILDAVKALFPAVDPVVRVGELVARRTTDTVSVAESA